MGEERSRGKIVKLNADKGTGPKHGGLQEEIGRGRFSTRLKFLVGVFLCQKILLWNMGGGGTRSGKKCRSKIKQPGGEDVNQKESTPIFVEN